MGPEVGESRREVDGREAGDACGGGVFRCYADAQDAAVQRTADGVDSRLGISKFGAPRKGRKDAPRETGAVRGRSRSTPRPERVIGVRSRPARRRF